MSTAGQDLDGQPIALAVQGVESGQVFTDKLSVAVNTDRPGRAAQLHYAREGDTVVVTAIDRPGRSVAEVTRTIAELGERRTLLRLTRRHRYRHTYRPRGGRHHGHPAELPKLDPDPHRAVQCSAVQCIFLLATAVNRLRNDAGTGHGRPGPPRKTSELSAAEARLVAHATALVAGALLDKLDGG